MRYLTAFHFETIHVVDKPKAFTKQAQEAYITLQGSDLRYRYDGGEPHALSGHLLLSGNSLRIEGDDQVSKFRMISTSDKPAIVSVSYERV